MRGKETEDNTQLPCYTAISMSALPIEDGAFKLLVRRAQEGDTDAFGQIYDVFFLSVYRYTAFRLPKEIAEDVTADIFVKAWEKLHTYKVHRGVPFGAWLFRIARYTVIDAYRTQRGFEEVPETLPDTDTYNQAHHRMEQSERLRIVRKVLDDLPKRYREVLVLSYISELPHEAISELLDLTVGAVRVLKSRALRRFREALPPDLQE